MGRFLTQRDLQQLAAGSALMLANIKIESGVVIRGGAALLEHPAESSPIQQTLCGAAPGAQRIQIQQWKYGAQAIKPTTIRVIGLPPSAKFLHAQTIPVLRRLEGFLQEEINPQHILRPPGPCGIMTCPASYFCTNLCTINAAAAKRGARCPLSAGSSMAGFCGRCVC